MRDVLYEYGTLSLATADTQVYSSDQIDHDVIDSRFRKTAHTPGRDEVLCFEPTTDFAAIDGFIPIIQDSADNITYAECLRGPEITAPKKGKTYGIPMPLKHRRYTRASAVPKSSGVFTAKTLNIHVEAGPNLD